VDTLKGRNINIQLHSRLEMDRTEAPLAQDRLYSDRLLGGSNPCSRRATAWRRRKACRRGKGFLEGRGLPQGEALPETNAPI